jgi:hypothetical protein
LIKLEEEGRATKEEVDGDYEWRIVG